MSLQVGELVTWTSSSQASQTRKTGTVLAIVPPGMTIDEVLRPADLQDYNAGPIKWAYENGLTRSHESYLVRVPSDSAAKPKLYWPLVSKLKKARK